MKRSITVVVLALVAMSISVTAFIPPTDSRAVMVKDIVPGPGSSNPGHIDSLVFGKDGPVINGVLFFAATDAAHGNELWRSDGTAAGTVLVKDINPGPASSHPRRVNVFNGLLIFAANDGTAGDELWRSDGTEAGTTLVKDVRPGPMAGIVPSWPFTPSNGQLYFVANDGTSGSELWKTDGTAAGTVLVKDVNPGAGHGVFEEDSGLIDVNGTLFFAGYDATLGLHLWKSDGTTAGTVVLKDVTVTSNAWFTAVYNVNGVLVFGVQDDTMGSLWRSDGTPGGTVAIAPMGTRACGTVKNGILYFNADDGLLGAELWRTDGTLAGTALVKDIRPGSLGSDACGMVQVGGVIFFGAITHTHGSELWKTDGT